MNSIVISGINGIKVSIAEIEGFELPEIKSSENPYFEDNAEKLSATAERFGFNCDLLGRLAGNLEPTCNVTIVCKRLPRKLKKLQKKQGTYRPRTLKIKNAKVKMTVKGW